MFTSCVLRRHRQWSIAEPPMLSRNGAEVAWIAGASWTANDGRDSSLLARSTKASRLRALRRGVRSAQQRDRLPVRATALGRQCVLGALAAPSPTAWSASRSTSPPVSRCQEMIEGPDEPNPAPKRHGHHRRNATSSCPARQLDAKCSSYACLHETYSPSLKLPPTRLRNPLELSSWRCD